MKGNCVNLGILPGIKLSLGEEKNPRGCSRTRDDVGFYSIHFSSVSPTPIIIYKQMDLHQLGDTAVPANVASTTTTSSRINQRMQTQLDDFMFFISSY